MSLEEDWAVEQVRELAARVKRIEDETGITEADEKARKEERDARRKERDDAKGRADDEADDGETVKLTPREKAAQQAEVDTGAQAVQAQADNDGPAGVTEKSRAKGKGKGQTEANTVAEGDETGPTKDPQNEGDAFDPTKGDEPEPKFDPTRHTIGEVNAHLKDADPRERDRILAAERAGQNRSGVKGT